MADQYRNIELERMFQDLGRALQENDARRARSQAQAAPLPAAPEQTAPPGVPTARFADVPTPPTARFPDANPPGVQQAAPLTVAAVPRRPMTADEQALSNQLDTMGGNVVAGLRGNGVPAAGAAPQAGMNQAALDELERRATLGMGQPAALPQIQPVDTSGLDAYARMQRGM